MWIHAFLKGKRAKGNKTSPAQVWTRIPDYIFCDDNHYVK